MQALRLSLAVLLLLVASSGAMIHYVDVSNSIYSVLSSGLVSAGDTLIVLNGTYPNEMAYTLTKNLTINFEGEVNISMLGTPTYWLNINSPVTMGGSGSLTLNKYGIVVGQAAVLTQNVSIEVVDTTYSAMVVSGSAIWNQLKDFTVTHSSSLGQDQEQIAIRLGSQWTQSGALSIRSVNATGVLLDTSAWTQYGTVSINVSTERVTPLQPGDIPVQAVQLGSNCGWQSAGPSVSMELFGTATQGVLLQGGSIWHQACPLHINQTFVAVGILISGGTWHQTGPLTMTSKGPQKGVGWDPAGVWNQSAEAHFVFDDQGYPVFFDGGGVWNQNAFTDFQLTDRSYGVALKGGGTWNQGHNTTISVTNGRGVNFVNDDGVWNQAPSTRISCTCANGSIGVLFEQGGQWNQSGVAQMTADDTSVGVQFMNGGQWLQKDQTNITTAPGSLGSAVGFNGTGVWDQRATAHVSGVKFYDGTCANCEWRQSAPLFVTTNGTGVYVAGGGSWRQTGPVQVNVTSDAEGRGVYLGGGSVWLQAASVSMNIVASAHTLVNCKGVMLGRGIWTATAPTTIVGTNAVVGVMLLANAEYNQGGTLDVAISGSLDLSAGVFFAAGAPLWRQSQTAVLRVTNATGVLFGAGLGATWQQLASATITIQGNATGISLAQGGQWTQQVPVNIGTIAQGSSTSITKGFVCGGSSTCCNRIQSPIYLPNIIFTTAVRNAGVRDDCPAASASPSPLAIGAVVVNTTATFRNSTPSVSIGGTASSTPSSGGTGTREVAVQLSLTNLLVGNSSATPTDYTLTQQVTNSTSGGANTTTTTYVYAAQLDNATSVAQAYTFFAQKATTTFAGTTFTVGAGSLKWSINLTTTTTTDAANATNARDGGSPGLTLRYELASLLNASAVPSADGAVIRKPNTPQNQMTTYIVRLDNDTVAQLELFDVALVDDQLTFINHSLTIAATTTTNGTSSSTNGTVRGYVLELQLPAFNHSLFYDPSLGLGVLLGGSTRSDGSGSDDNTALIVATAVAIPVAVVVVVAVVAVAVIVAWRRKREHKRSSLELDHVLHDSSDQSL